MKILPTIFAALALPICAVAQSTEATDTVTVFMIGDSTMANKPLDKENQERGWGQMLPMYLTGPVKVDNHAVNGRSSKSFIDEGRWDKVLEKIRPGDYVIIQFGHNDEKPKADRHTDPGSTFDDNLRKFVNESRNKGATPILMNSIVRRNFPTSDGKGATGTDDLAKSLQTDKNEFSTEGKILVDTHGDYIIAPRNVATELAVFFIDMNAATHELVQGLGAEQSKTLFMWIPENTYEFCPKGKIDNTHLNVKGAIQVAGLAIDRMAAEIPGFARFVRPEVYNLKQ